MLRPVFKGLRMGNRLDIFEKMKIDLLKNIQTHIQIYLKVVARLYHKYLLCNFDIDINLYRETVSRGKKLLELLIDIRN